MSRCHHGMVEGRGCAHLKLGHFGRLFPHLEPLFSHDSLLEALGKPGGIMDGDRTPDSNIPAGYTFFAQFVDHDVTLDTKTKLDSDQVQDPNKVPNFRSPSLDLDCVYGFGPEASAHLYEGSTEKVITGTAANPEDLARAKDGTALIGDPRNDENIFVNQMHNLFIKLHNKFIDSGYEFEEAQRESRYHYQYIVLHDFLKRVCDPVIYKFALERLYRREFPLCYEPDDHGGLFMPVEFSVAAYRFGHSMVRSQYRVRNTASGRIRRVELFDETLMAGGFTALPPEITLDWRLLLDIDGSRPDASKAVDARLATELNNLPFLEAGEPNPNRRSLAFRNLLRGRSLGLPSGQAVAEALADCGYPIEPEVLSLPARRFPGVGALSAKDKHALQHETPLFFYLLAEGGDNDHLGPTGSAILMEVFGGMLTFCKGTFLSDLSWSPDNDIVSSDHNLTLGDIARYVSS
ncbi:MAG: heme peroxidase family protein [Pseudomonadota bacterium]